MVGFIVGEIGWARLNKNGMTGRVMGLTVRVGRVHIGLGSG